MGNDRMRRVAVIVPAFNEEARIANVLKAVCGAKLASEIIVVSDGSRDRTAEVARRFPNVEVIELMTNLGKGGAMAEGVLHTDAPFIAFVDADLDSLKPEHIDQIIQPVLMERCDMCIGVFRGGKVWSDTAQMISPFLSGQRAMRRDLFESIPYMSELRMGVEYALTQAAKRRRAKVLRVVLRGVSNCHKEKKMGLMKGTAARLKMYREITQAMVRTRSKKRVRPRGRHRWRK